MKHIDPVLIAQLREDYAAIMERDNLMPFTEYVEMRLKKMALEREAMSVGNMDVYP